MLRWRLTEEPGTLRSGECSVASLPRLDEREAGGEKFVSRLLDLDWRLSRGLSPSRTRAGRPARCRSDARGRAGALLASAARSKATAACGAARCSSTDCGRRAIGGSATSATCSPWSTRRPRAAPISVGLNPMHARFSHNPAHCSPYSPSSRLSLNTLYIDVEALDDFGESDDARRLVRAAAVPGASEALRNERAGRLRRRRARQGGGAALVVRAFPRRASGRGHRARRGVPRLPGAGGRALRRHCLFEALQAHLHQADESIWGWPVWPRSLPRSATRRRSGDSRASDRTRSSTSSTCSGRPAAADRARGRALRERWAWRSVCISTWRCRSTGRAPTPGPIATASPRWRERRRAARRLQSQGPGLGPAAAHPRGPTRVRVPAVRARAAREHAPCGRAAHRPRDGPDAAVTGFRPGATAHTAPTCTTRCDEMLAIVALESHRNDCMVIGEDLGTVADEVREALAASRGAVVPPDCTSSATARASSARPSTYPHHALVAISTHDLPTLAGWWAGDDLQLRQRTGPVSRRGVARHAAARSRGQDRARAGRSAGREQPLAADTDPQAARDPLSAELVDAVHVYLARSPARLMMVQPEDCSA